MADQQLHDKVDAVVAQMREMILDYGLVGFNTIWCHGQRAGGWVSDCLCRQGTPVGAEGEP